LGNGFLDTAAESGAGSWLAKGATAEIQKILRQNEMDFRLFVGTSVVVCALILAAMLLS
jgi:hypothetical protein